MDDRPPIEWRVGDPCATPHGIGTIRALHLTSPCNAAADVAFHDHEGRVTGWANLPLTMVEPLST